MDSLSDYAEQSYKDDVKLGVKNPGMKCTPIDSIIEDIVTRPDFDLGQYMKFKLETGGCVIEYGARLREQESQINAAICSFGNQF